MARNKPPAKCGSQARRGSVQAFQTVTGASSRTPRRATSFPVAAVKASPATPRSKVGTHASRRPTGDSIAARGSRNRLSATEAGTNRPGAQASAFGPNRASGTQIAPPTDAAQPSQAQAVYRTTAQAAAETKSR